MARTKEVHIGRVSFLEGKEATNLDCFFIQLLLQNLKQMLFCDKLVIIIMMNVCVLCRDAQTNHYYATKNNCTLVCDEQQIFINR